MYGLSAINLTSSSVPAFRYYSATKSCHKTISGVSAAIGQPFIYSTILIMLIMLNAAHLPAQVNAGSIISYNKIPGGIEGKASNAIFDIHAYNDHIFRVRISPGKSFQNFSYALATNDIPSFTNIDIIENDSSILISTASVIAEVRRFPQFNIIFRNKRNEIINADVEGESFGTSFNGNKISTCKMLQPGERFVGLGEALGNLDRRGSGITLNNTDNYKYGDSRLPMYSSIPFYIGIHSNLVYGLFFNNSYKSFFNFGLSTPYTSVNFGGGDMDYFFIYDTTVAKVIAHYASLTGRMPLPPLWSLGYHQSRADYYQDKALSVAQAFRTKQIPVDCIVLDAEYQYGYEPFRIDSSRFPDIKKLANDLLKMKIELTASVYPGVKIDSTYDSYKDGLKKDAFIKYNDGTLFKTEIAPLECYLPDYTNPATRDWWKSKMKWFADNHIHGYWNDMNEPAVGGSYLPDNLAFDFDGRKSGAGEAKNIYGFQMARSSYEAGLQNEKNMRPFVLTRSGFAGVQRYAAMWSGDNTASNEGLLTSVLLNSQMGLSGVPFIGYDIGGFIGNGSRQLFTRWMEAGIFSPFCRNHKEMYAVDNEPWSYGTETEAIARSYIDFRYRLMPYIYSKFYEAAETGMPIARSLCINYPFDRRVYAEAYQSEFLFGDAIFVAPLTTSKDTSNIYLPKGEWFNLFTDEQVSGERELVVANPIYQIPLFVKASSIIPLQSSIQSTKEKPSDTLFLHIYNGNEKNEFIFYEDAGNGFDYKNGVYNKRKITFDAGNRAITISKQEGSFTSWFKKVQIIFHGFAKSPLRVHVDGKQVTPVPIVVKLLDPLKNLKDIYDTDYFNSLSSSKIHSKQWSVLLNYEKTSIKINW